MADELNQNPPPISRKRWLVLFVVIILNASNAILWLSFSSVTNMASQYYEVPEKHIDYFSLVFCISVAAAGLLVVWIVDKQGLRFAILLGAALNCTGAIIRLISTYWKTYSFAVVMVGQVIAALSQPFLCCIPTKVAEQWFPDNQRTLATSLAVMANLVGQLIGCGITPLFVTSIEKIEDMNRYYLIPCIIGCLTASAIRSPKPDVPPSNSASITINYPYCPALRTFFSRKESIFLIFGVGSVLGVSYTLMSRMEEILCTRGYDNIFTGVCTMALMGCGLVGAVIASIVADRTRSFIPIIKICLTLMVLSLCFFAGISRHENQKILILVASSLVGFFAYAAFPVGLELAMEHSFTVLPEATSSGLILITGQFLSIIYFVFFETLSPQYPVYVKEKCMKMKHISSDGHPGPMPLDTTCPLLILAGITTLLVCVFILFFKSDYNRMKTENRSMSAIVNDEDPIINSTSFEDPNWHTSIYS